MKSARANEISAYIQDRQPEKNLFERVTVDGKVETLTVYSIPTSKLYYNIRNGRFAAELRAKEKEIKRTLDPHKPADAILIQKLLLEQNDEETEILKADLVRHGQVDPGIITSDGAIINANRRMAVITSLFEETHDPKWEYLKVAILPSAVSEKDLWRIEAGLQFAKDFRLEYGPINELLKLREGINCGLKPEDISVSLLGRYTPDKVRGRLEVLKLIDSYLESIGKSGEYELIGQERLMEKFNSLNDNVLASLKREDYKKTELARIGEAGFALIYKTDRSHWDIRKLSQIARQDTAYKAFKDALPKSPLDATPEQLDDAFQAGAELVEDEKEKEKPERLLKRALTAVSSINASSPLLKSPGVRALITKLKDAVAALQK
ncbi:MAG: hypothetical protein JWM91_5469 [Rhodospirillales bacterium]|nr:hypothetical protein [Rhodospirillales bacterium]